MIRAKRRDKHIRNPTLSSKNRLHLSSGQTDHRGFKSESMTKKIRFQFLPCVFAKRISKGSSFQSLGAATEKALLEHSADLDHWNEVSVPFAMAEACFKYILVVHWSEPGRSGSTI